MPAAASQSRGASPRCRRRFLPPVRSSIGPRSGFLGTTVRPCRRRGQADAEIELRQLRPAGIGIADLVVGPHLCAGSHFMIVGGHDPLPPGDAVDDERVYPPSAILMHVSRSRSAHLLFPARAPRAGRGSRVERPVHRRRTRDRKPGRAAPPRAGGIRVAQRGRLQTSTFGVSPASPRRRMMGPPGLEPGTNRL